jgi:hypothetical protein
LGHCLHDPQNRRRGEGPEIVKQFIPPLAIGAVMALAAPAQAAPVAASPSAQAQALILVPLTLTKVDDLDFGTVISSPISGTVVIPADGSARSAAGGVTLVPSDPGLRARFAGAGSPGRLVIINATNPGTLSNGLGDTVTILALTLDGSPIRTIDPTTRAFFFHVGGILQINANQAEGLYSAQFDVTAEYL